jgi:hypothetical protein
MVIYGVFVRSDGLKRTLPTKHPNCIYKRLMKRLLITSHSTFYENMLSNEALDDLNKQRERLKKLL